MKKFVALLLILVLTVSALSITALAADPVMPLQVPEADAGVKVTSSTNSEVYYFDTLDNDLVAWVCHDVPGDKTITLLKDLSLSNPGATGARFITIPSNLDQWYNRSTTSKLIIDLNKKTLSYTGISNLFYCDRFGLELRNGTIRYTGEGASRNIVCFGSSGGRTATTAGTTVWTPTVTFDHVNAFNLTEEAGGVVVRSAEYAPRINVKNSTLWCNATLAIYITKTTQADIGSGTPYTGDFDARIDISNSTVGSSKNYAIGATDPVKLTVQDSLLVSNGKKGTMTGNDDLFEIEANTAEPEIQEDWSKTVDGIAMSGKSFMYGLAGELPELPFTDVAESDWYYTFVQDLYFKNVIDGMTATTFVPNGTLTYGQALKLIALGIGESEPQKTGTHWASGYLKLAQDKGWIAGDVNLDASISRLAFCQIAAKAKGLTEQPASNPFTDTSDPAVLALNKADVIGGMGDGKFAPDATLTRAQISKIVSLLSEL